MMQIALFLFFFSPQILQGGEWTTRRSIMIQPDEADVQYQLSDVGADRVDRFNNTLDSPEFLGQQVRP